MITTYQVLRENDSILMGIGFENAVLDMVTSEAQLRECLQMLEERHNGWARRQVGTFGGYRVTCNLGDDDVVTILVDGPSFVSARRQSAVLWVSKDDWRRLLMEALEGGCDRARTVKGET